MIYQLPNGKCVEMSVEQFLDLSDQDVSELVGLSPVYTIESNNPFFKCFSQREKKRDPELDHEVEPNLTQINSEDKLGDKDFHRDDN